MIADVQEVQIGVLRSQWWKERPGRLWNIELVQTVDLDARISFTFER